MNVIAWIIFGTVTGIIANIIEPEDGSLFGSIALGILGAVLGGFLANLMLGASIVGFSFTSLLGALVSSLVILLTQKVLVKKNEPI